MNKRETGRAGWIVRALGVLGLSLLPSLGLAQGLSQVQTVTGSTTSGTTITLPSWTPAANDLILVAVALRDETKSVSVTGNGLTFVQIADLDNAQGQTGVNLFRAMGASPTSGSITVAVSGNTLPVVVSATRFSGADTSGLHGSGAIEAVATDAGPPVTDNKNMKVNVTTLAANAFAYAAGTHRLATFTVPAGETAISVNNVAGADGDKTTLSTWYEAVPTPGTVTLGADNDLNSDRDWAVVAISIRPAGSAGQALSQTETVTASITSGGSITLPAWTPAPNDLILVAVALRDETKSVSVSGNGLTFVEIANLDNAQNQTGVNLFRAMGASPTPGSITVTVSGNTLPAIASATRFAGADTSGTNGSGAIEALATDAGPPATDNDDMKINVTTVSANAWAYAAGTHRLATFALPSGQVAISTNNFAGASGDTTTLSTWYQAAPTPATVTLGADNDLSSVRDWAVIAVSLKPGAAAPPNAPPTVAITSPVGGENFQFPAAPIPVSANAQDSDGTVTQVEFFANGALIGGVTASPFTIQWSNVAVGDYTLTARATDNAGAQTTSAAVNVTVRAPQVFYMHTDHLDTPRLIANSAGQAVWSWANDDPFGVNVPNENPSGLGIFTCNLRLPGQYFDKESNTHYNYFRDYDSSIGRYIQSDPIGLAGGINTYSYVASNPLRWIDPPGLYTEIIQWAPIYFTTGHWGHVSGNINGQSFSFEGPGWVREDPTAEAYADRQVNILGRGGRGIILDLSPTEETLLKQCLESTDLYGPITNNCGNPYLRCLDRLGVVDIRDKARVLPTDVYRILSSSPRAIGRTTYGESFPGVRQPR